MTTKAMDEEIAKRLEKIESALAHLEQLYDSLNEVVIEQGSAIKKLKAQQQRIGQTVERMETDRIKADRSKPPHHGT